MTTTINSYELSLRLGTQHSDLKKLIRRLNKHYIPHYRLTNPYAHKGYIDVYKLSVYHLSNLYKRNKEKRAIVEEIMNEMYIAIEENRMRIQESIRNMFVYREL